MTYARNCNCSTREVAVSVYGGRRRKTGSDDVASPKISWSQSRLGVLAGVVTDLADLHTSRSIFVSIHIAIEIIVGHRTRSQQLSPHRRANDHWHTCPIPDLTATKCGRIPRVLRMVRIFHRTGIHNLLMLGILQIRVLRGHEHRS